MRGLLTTVSVVVVLVLLAAASQGQQMSTQKPAAPLCFRVTGEAEAMPDVVILHFSAVGDGETLGKAQEGLDQTEQTIAKALERFDIKRAQMKVERYSIMPLTPNLDSSPMNPTMLPALGYRAQRDYTITPASSLKSVGKLLQIADVVLQQGARPTSSAPDAWRMESYGNRLPGMLLEFKASDTGKLTRAALTDAINKARKLAVEASKGMGKHTLRLATVNTSDTVYFPKPVYTPDRSDDPPDGSPALQAVKVTVSAEVGFYYD
jgi:uncharacterized protein YggE